MPTAEDELRQVGRHISHWISEVSESNTNSFQDINKVSEGLAQQLLHLVFGYELRDLNAEKANFPGIDLGQNGKLAIQVTSRTDLAKYREDIQTFNDNNYVETFPEGIRFFVINISFRRRKLNLQLPNFDDRTGIIYAQDLRKFISPIYYQDQPRYRLIKELLEQEFPLRPSKPSSTGSAKHFLSADTVPSIRTELIILEIDKIIEAYHKASNNWDDRKEILEQLYRFLDHNNEHIADRIFPFLHDIHDVRMEKKCAEKALVLKSLICTFLPSSLGNGNRMGIDNGKQCCYIGHDLAYDGFIHINNFRVAEWGLLTMKYVYQLGKRNHFPALVEEVNAYYDLLHEQVHRKGRPDLQDARALLKIFREDLDFPGLFTPDMPARLFAQLIDPAEPKVD